MTNEQNSQLSLQQNSQLPPPPKSLPSQVVTFVKLHASSRGCTLLLAASTFVLITAVLLVLFRQTPAPASNHNIYFRTQAIEHHPHGTTTPSPNRHGLCTPHRHKISVFDTHPHKPDEQQHPKGDPFHWEAVRERHEDRYPKSHGCKHWHQDAIYHPHGRCKSHYHSYQHKHNEKTPTNARSGDPHQHDSEYDKSKLKGHDDDHDCIHEHIAGSHSHGICDHHKHDWLRSHLGNPSQNHPGKPAGSLGSKPTVAQLHEAVKEPLNHNCRHTHKNKDASHAHGICEEHPHQNSSHRGDPYLPHRIVAIYELHDPYRPVHTCEHQHKVYHTHEDCSTRHSHTYTHNDDPTSSANHVTGSPDDVTRLHAQDEHIETFKLTHPCWHEHSQSHPHQNCVNHDHTYQHKHKSGQLPTASHTSVEKEIRQGIHPLILGLDSKSASTTHPCAHQHTAVHKHNPRSACAQEHAHPGFTHKHLGNSETPHRKYGINDVHDKTLFNGVSVRPEHSCTEDGARLALSVPGKPGTQTHDHLGSCPLHPHTFEELNKHDDNHQCAHYHTSWHAHKNKEYSGLRGKLLQAFRKYNSCLATHPHTYISNHEEGEHNRDGEHNQASQGKSEEREDFVHALTPHYHYDLEGEHQGHLLSVSSEDDPSDPDHMNTHGPGLHKCYATRYSVEHYHAGCTEHSHNYEHWGSPFETDSSPSDPYQDKHNMSGRHTCVHILESEDLSYPTGARSTARTSAITASILEPRKDSADVQITFKPNAQLPRTTENINLTWEISGTATLGEDYTITGDNKPGAATLTADQTSKTITLNILADDEYSKVNETIIITVTSNPTHNRGTFLNTSGIEAPAPDSHLAITTELTISITEPEKPAFDPSTLYLT